MKKKQNTDLKGRLFCWMIGYLCVVYIIRLTFVFDVSLVTTLRRNKDGKMKLLHNTNKLTVFWEDFSTVSAPGNC